MNYKLIEEFIKITSKPVIEVKEPNEEPKFFAVTDYDFDENKYLVCTGFLITDFLKSNTMDDLRMTNEFVSKVISFIQSVDFVTKKFSPNFYFTIHI